MAQGLSSRVSSNDLCRVILFDSDENRVSCVEIIIERSAECAQATDPENCTLIAIAISFTFRMTKVKNTKNSQTLNRRLHCCRYYVAHARFTQSFNHLHFDGGGGGVVCCAHAVTATPPHSIFAARGYTTFDGCARVLSLTMRCGVYYKRIMIVLLLQIEMMRDRCAQRRQQQHRHHQWVNVVYDYLNNAKTTWQNQIESLFN